MVRTAINLYSVRELEEPLSETVERVAEAGYDGVQFSGLGDADVGDLAATVEDVGLDVTAAHVGLDELENDLSGAIDTYTTLGCDSFVVPYLGAEHFESREAVEETADRLTSLADRLADRGLGLHYHNHDHEFVDLGDQSGFELFLEKTEFFIELDVGWAATAGYDPAQLLERIGDRGPLVHMKDMDTENREFAEIGEGDVDMQACADVAREAGAEWLIYEHDQPDDPIASLEYGAEYLSSL